MEVEAQTLGKSHSESLMCPLQGELKFSASSKEHGPGTLGTKVGPGTCGTTSGCFTPLREAQTGIIISPTHPSPTLHPRRTEKTSSPSQLQPGFHICGPAGGICLHRTKASTSQLRLNPGSKVSGAAGNICLCSAKASSGSPRAHPISNFQGPEAVVTHLCGT